MDTVIAVAGMVTLIGGVGLIILAMCVGRHEQ